jgi:hypothetical protein
VAAWWEGGGAGQDGAAFLDASFLPLLPSLIYQMRTRTTFKAREAMDQDGHSMQSADLMENEVRSWILDATIGTLVVFYSCSS